MKTLKKQNLIYNSLFMKYWDEKIEKGIPKEIILWWIIWKQSRVGHEQWWANLHLFASGILVVRGDN